MTIQATSLLNWIAETSRLKSFVYNQTMADEFKQSKRGGKRANAGRKPKAKAAAPKAENKPKSEGRWKPGQSGNPGGRPAVIREVRDLARAHTAIAFGTLLAICQDDEAPPAARVTAAAHILDRGFGKPQQNIKATVTHLRNMSDDELLGYLSGDNQGEGGEGAFDAPGGSQITH